MINYNKLNEDCFISHNESRNISAFIKFMHGSDREFIEILILEQVGFSFILECIIENDELRCYNTHTIDFNFSSILENKKYWKDTLESIFTLVYSIYNNEYKEMIKCM